MLVGPNGAGKTNIVDALSFLSQLCRGSVTEAVSHLGGAGKVISRAANIQETHEVRFEVKGSRIVSSEQYYHPPIVELLRRGTLRGIRLAEYTYSLSLCFERNRIYAKSESLLVTILRIRRFGGEIRVVEKVTPQRSPDYLLDRRVRLGETPVVRRAGSSVGGKFSREFTQGEFVRELSGKSYFGGDPYGERTLFAHAAKSGDALVRQIFGDFQLGDPVNIVPDRVRAIMDIAAPPGIERDGYGLPATLWSITRGSHPSRTTKGAQKERLLAYVQRVNPNVRDIDVEPDTWESTIRVVCKIGETEPLIRVSLTQLSDGTLKWIALMTAIVTDTPFLAIEEPENFIHPAVQKALVDILREQFFSAFSVTEFALLTTHSETLINSLEPSELIVVSMSDARTSALRPSNSDLLLSEIKRTGFGLGYYYLAGVLDD